MQISSTQYISSRVRQSARVPRPPSLSKPNKIVCSSIAQDAADGWLDLTKFVSGGGGSKSPYDDLASEIGKQVYVDLAGWHLYMRDMSANPTMKMSVALAMQLGPKASQGLRESDIEAVLKKIPIKAGAGKMKVSLYDITPSMCIGDLTKIVEDFGRK